MNYKEAYEDVAAGLVYPPKHLTPDEIKWVEETAQRIVNSKMEGEDILATYSRHDYPISLSIREEMKQLFPESDWSLLGQYLLREVCVLDGIWPLWK